MKTYIEDGSAFAVIDGNLIVYPFDDGVITYDEGHIWGYLEEEDQPLLDRVNNALGVNFVIDILTLTNKDAQRGMVKLGDIFIHEDLIFVVGEGRYIATDSVSGKIINGCGYEDCKVWLNHCKSAGNLFNSLVADSQGVEELENILLHAEDGLLTKENSDKVRSMA